MKNRILSILSFPVIICTSYSEIIKSPELNVRVWDNETYGVDIDMDGMDDLVFYSAREDPSRASIHNLRILTEDNVYVCNSASYGFPTGPTTYYFVFFQEGTQIDEENLSSPDYHWRSGELSWLPDYGPNFTITPSSYDIYIAIKKETDSGVNYGWVRLIFPRSYDYFSETGYVKIKESSYQSIPSSPIIAGLGKAEKASSYSNSIQISGTGTFDLKVNGVSNMQCMLQESLDLSDWDTISVEYSTQPNLTKGISTNGTSKFYRWQVTENLEEID